MEYKREDHGIYNAMFLKFLKSNVVMKQMLLFFKQTELNPWYFYIYIGAAGAVFWVSHTSMHAVLHIAILMYVCTLP